jgi:glutaredoxin-dependent peroxiredoxin
VVLRIGQRIPDFALPDTDGKVRSFSDLSQKGTLVVVFFPLAFSGVCDKELCTFRDEFAGFADLRARLVGISVDSAFALKAFAQTYNLPFPLLSDFNKKVVKSFGVLQDPWVAFGYRGVAKRSVFVVDQKGILRYRWSTDVPSEEPPYEDVRKVAAKLSR